MEITGAQCGAEPVKGTRVEPNTILTDYAMGPPVEEIHENFPTVSLATIERIIAFAYRPHAVP